MTRTPSEGARTPSDAALAALLRHCAEFKDVDATVKDALHDAATAIERLLSQEAPAQPAPRDLSDRISNKDLLHARQWAVERALAHIPHDVELDVSDVLRNASEIAGYVLSGDLGGDTSRPVGPLLGGEDLGIAGRLGRDNALGDEVEDVGAVAVDPIAAASTLSFSLSDSLDQLPSNLGSAGCNVSHNESSVGSSTVPTMEQGGRVNNDPIAWSPARSSDCLWLISSGHISPTAADALSDEQATTLAERIKARIREGVG